MLKRGVTCVENVAGHYTGAARIVLRDRPHWVTAHQCKVELVLTDEEVEWLKLGGVYNVTIEEVGP